LTAFNRQALFRCLLMPTAERSPATVALPRKRGRKVYTWQRSCGIALALATLLPACGFTPPRSANPFDGAWNTAERQQIAFRDDTVVMNPPGSPPTPLGASVCEGRFYFVYNRKTRDALLALTPQQPELRQRLAAQLAGPQYNVAELTCGDGGTTYVLLGERDVLAIHHDRGIAALERLSR
jgi:hypothetical protein